MSEPNSYTMPLSRPIRAHGEELSELVLKDPDSEALEGVEITIGPKGATFDLGAMNRLISSAAGIPLSSARQIRMADTMKHLMPVLDFFGIDTPLTGEG